MPGANVHSDGLYCAWAISRLHIKDYNFSIKNPGWKSDLVGEKWHWQPDLDGPSHGADVPNNVYRIVDMADEKYNRLISLLSSGASWKNVAVQKTINYLTHYCVDALTIGQISGTKFWGKHDDWWDAGASLVTGRKEFLRYAYTINPNHFNIPILKLRCEDTYYKYLADANRWSGSWYEKVSFIMSRHEAHMIKRAVVYGGQCSAIYIIKAWQQTKDKIGTAPEGRYPERDINDSPDRTRKDGQ